MSSTTSSSSSSSSTSNSPPAQYPFQQIEKKWQTYWEEEETFKTPVRNGAGTLKPKKYVLDMFPYPSGAGLHVGHPEGYTASDAMARYYRMTGHDVLHPMGWDSFGLPAEQYAIQTGTHPAVTTNKNIDNFRRQLKSLGFSYDWDLEVATTDTDYMKWTQWIFLQIFKKKLAVQSKVLVNWCPKLGTVLANEEVIDGLSERGDHPVERLPLRQWTLMITKYADRLEQGLEGLDWPSGTMSAQKSWIGRSVGCTMDFKVAKKVGEEGGSNTKDNDKVISVFTTRADTVMGVTYLTLAPEHPLVSSVTSSDQKKEVDEYVNKASRRSDMDRTTDGEKTGVFTGGYAVHPLTGENVPIWVGDYVLGSYGTGAVMAVPAHDDRDFEFARKYNLSVKRVVIPVGWDNDQKKDDAVLESAFTEHGVNFNSGNEFDGLTTVEAKLAVSTKLESISMGGSKITYKLRDWVFSRQRYWGEPIPIYFPVDFPEGGDIDPSSSHVSAEDVAGCEHTIRYDKPIAVDESDLPLELPPMENFEPGTDPAGCLARALDWRYFRGEDDGKWYARETNTMPQWAGSCWYYLRFTDPGNIKEAFGKKADESWMPVDLYIGGAEHAVLHLLYARFWHQVLFDLGLTSHPEPFQKLVHQGMILGDDGEKMSKSRGNVVNPDDIVDTHGADALRLYEMFMGPLEAVKPWQTSQVSGVVRFQNKLYNIVKAVAATSDEQDKGGDGMTEETRRLLHKTMKKVTNDIESMSFNTAISSMMVLTNHLQSIISEGNGGDKASLPSRVAVEALVIMVSPFAPHLAEECWSMLGHDSSLAFFPWVIYDEELCVENVVSIGVQVNGKVRGAIEISKDADQESAMTEAMNLERVKAQLEGKDLKRIIYVPGKILNLVVK